MSNEVENVIKASKILTEIADQIVNLGSVDFDADEMANLKRISGLAEQVLGVSADELRALTYIMMERMNPAYMAMTMVDPVGVAKRREEFITALMFGAMLHRRVIAKREAGPSVN